MNAQTSKPKKACYPHKAKVLSYVQIARDLGLDVAGFEVSPNGSIRVFEAPAAPATAPQSDFDRFKDQL
jgi:hypothetical protein